MSKGVKSNSEVKNSSFLKEIFGMAMVLFAVLAFICLVTGDLLFYTLGASVQGFLLAIFGVYAFLFLIDFAVLGLKLASGKSFINKDYRISYFVARVALFCVFCIIHLAVSHKAGLTWSEQISATYQGGMGGFATTTVAGVFGALFVASVVLVASQVGTYFLFIIVFLICMFYLFRKPIIGLIRNGRNGSVTRKRSSKTTRTTKTTRRSRSEDEEDEEDEDVHDDERDFGAFDASSLNTERPHDYFLDEESGFQKKTRRDINRGTENDLMPFSGDFEFKDPTLNERRGGARRVGGKSSYNFPSDDLRDYDKPDRSEEKIDLRERKDSVGDLGSSYRAFYKDNARKGADKPTTDADYGKRTEVSDVISRSRPEPEDYDNDSITKDVYTVPLKNDNEPKPREASSANNPQRSKIEVSPFGGARKEATFEKSIKDISEETSDPYDDIVADEEEDMDVKHSEIRNYDKQEKEDYTSDDEFIEEEDDENENGPYGKNPVYKKEPRTVSAPPAALAGTPMASVFDAPKRKFVVEDDGSEPIENMPKNYRYTPPPITLLAEYAQDEQKAWEERNRQKWCAETIVKVIKNKKNIDVTVDRVITGPAVTRYDISIPEPYGPQDVMTARQDLAFRLQAGDELRMYMVPRSSYIGIEIPNKYPRTIGLKNALLSEDYAKTLKKKGLYFVFGEDLLGNTITMNINAMPHLLVCGTTGSGKSVCLNVLLVSLLYRYSPAELRIIIVDPKKVEFKSFKGIPHLVFNEILGTDNRTVAVLEWVVQEMERRYDFIGDNGCKDIFEYNELAESRGDKKMPCLLVLIDEYADLVMAQQQNKKKIESYIERLAQKARAAGISLICATQRASVSIISGSIKTNIVSKICFQTNSGVDSRVILDEQGAEKLLGKGDALYYIKGSETNSLKRGQGSFISNDEVKKVVGYVIEHNKCYFDNKLLETISEAANADEEDVLNKPQAPRGLPSRPDEVDEDFKRALRFAIKRQVISGSSLRTTLRIGYNKSASIIAWMEKMCYISPITENRMRKVQITREEYEKVYGEFVEDFD